MTTAEATQQPTDEVKAEQQSPASLLRSLFKAQKAIEPIVKDAENSHSRYRYVSAELIITESRAALLGAGLVARRASWSIEKDTFSGYAMVMMRFILTDVDTGEKIENDVCFPARERNGMPLDKAIAAALTGGFAYWLRDLLLIPRVDEEMDRRNDADFNPQQEQQGRCHEQQTQHQPQNQQQQTEEPPRPKVLWWNWCKERNFSVDDSKGWWQIIEQFNIPVEEAQKMAVQTMNDDGTYSFPKWCDLVESRYSQKQP